ncbi:unnamed protein product [Adineta steineri]|uniref:Uncharacterized protein n=1 Tax=Adineta steineri TaxID=433720 RepID=A0A818SEB8_9BILA|nr:unnamed protein product [Adineta steineri]CAF3671649.1 unnamed protein product [Adineta steineri]
MEESQVKLPNRYIVEDKHFALDSKFVITDETGNIYYTVDSTLFTMGDKLQMYDAGGNELIRIRQENLHLHKTYIIQSVRTDADEMQLASVKRTGLLGQHKLEIIAVDGAYIMEKRGNAFSHEFTLKKGDDVVAIVTKDPSPTKSIYWLDVSADRDEYRAFLVALVIVLSCAQRLPGNPLSTPHEGNAKP